MINGNVLEVGHSKLAVEGIDRKSACNKHRSACIMGEYGNHVAKEKMQLHAGPKGAKACRSKCRRLMRTNGVLLNILALKGSDNKWVLHAEDKAISFVDMCASFDILFSVAEDHLSLVS